MRRLNNTTRKNTWIVLTLAFTVVAVFAIAAVFSVILLRTYRSVAAENNEPQYRYGDLYYNCLDYRLQCLYDAIAETAEENGRATDIVPYQYTDEEFGLVVSSVKADIPSLIGFDASKCRLEYSGKKSRVIFDGRYDNAHLDGMNDLLYSAVSDITARALSESDGSTTSLLLSLHDILIRECSVSDDHDDAAAATAYGALVEHSATSSGYAAAFKLLCDELDIYCLSVFGRVYSTDHVWNLVWDGSDYRHIDVIWNDPDLVYIPELVSHAYFGLSDAEIERDHVILRSTIIPDALTDSDHYAENGSVLTASNAERTLSLLVDDCIRDKRRYAEFIFAPGYKPTPDALEALCEKIVDDREELSGKRLYRLSETSEVYALQLFYADK